MKVLTPEIKDGLEGATRAQVRSVIRVLKWQDINCLEAVVNFGDYIGLKFSYIFIGVERDGYAHS